VQRGFLPAIGNHCDVGQPRVDAILTSWKHWQNGVPD
jgi:purine nucleoside permease